jgi:hypothetical protein
MRKKEEKARCQLDPVRHAQCWLDEKSRVESYQSRHGRHLRLQVQARLNTWLMCIFELYTQCKFARPVYIFRDSYIHSRRSV